MKKLRKSKNKFLNKDKLKKQRRKMQTCLTNKVQIFKMKINSNINRINVENINSLITLLRDVIRNNN